MVEKGWIKQFKDNVLQQEELLKFFGIAGWNQYESVWKKYSVVFRKSQAYKSSPGATTAWLRQGELEAQKLPCSDFDSKTFRVALKRIRKFSLRGPQYFAPRMIDDCARSGVAIVFVPEVRGTRVFGATRWLTPRKALIQLSLRLKCNDHMWFTFFHEAGHILLHGKTQIFLEGSNISNRPEREADLFARDLLIPEEKYRAFVRDQNFSSQMIQRFAKSIGIHSGIVVGRLQHDKYIEHFHGNHLKIKYKLA